MALTWRASVVGVVVQRLETCGGVLAPRVQVVVVAEGDRFAAAVEGRRGRRALAGLTARGAWLLAGRRRRLQAAVAERGLAGEGGRGDAVRQVRRLPHVATALPHLPRTMTRRGCMQAWVSTKLFKRK